MWCGTVLYMEGRWVSVILTNEGKIRKRLFSLIAVNYEARDFGVKRGMESCLGLE